MDWFRERFVFCSKNSLKRHKVLKNINSDSSLMLDILLEDINENRDETGDNDAADETKDVGASSYRMMRRGGMCGDDLQMDLTKLKDLVLVEMMKEWNLF